MLLYTPDELIRFIEVAGESANIDAKGPMVWDGGEASAGLAKDIFAFANSRDGGVIVIGKDEPSPGTFAPTGLTSPQADSFETTKVATWVNNRVAPPVNLVCNRVQHDEKEFIVLTVAEFDDVPVICTKQFELEGKPPKVILRKGTLYIRTANAESAPLSSIDDLRTLIGLATRKRGQEMLTMFESMLKGRPLVRVASDEEQFHEEYKRIQSELADVLNDTLAAGGWTLIAYPTIYRSDRWNDSEGLESIIRRRSVHIRNEFPPSQRGTHRREWGICNDAYRDIWTLATSGLFACWLPFSENVRPFTNPYQDEPNIEPGKWLDFQPNVYTIIEMFMFLTRFVEEFEPGEDFYFRLRANSLAGRHLVSSNPRIDVGFGLADPCKASVFEAGKQLSVVEFQAEWEDICASMMKQFFDYFPGPPVPIKTMRDWVEAFKDRKF